MPIADAGIATAARVQQQATIKNGFHLARDIYLEIPNFSS